MIKSKTILKLERRFGKSEIDVVSKFGNNYFNGIKGWQFPKEKLKQANKIGQLLTMDLDFPGNRCALNCVYCFAKVGEQTGTYYRPDKGDEPLTIEEIKSHLLEAKDVGLESTKIIGYREPFDNPGIYEFIDFAAEQGIHLVIFTALYTLGEKRFDGNLEKAIGFLTERDVSLMVKLHTLDIKKEDAIVRKKGYSEIRDKYLKILLDDGRFTDKSTTRLGIENVIASQDINELLDIYKYFKMYRNVFVDLDPPIPVGRTGTLEEAEKAGLMPQDKLRELCVRTYRINQEYGILFNGISPYFGGDPCSQLPNGLYLTLSGKVLTCCGGDEEIGNVRENSLREIFENNPHRANECIYHACPYREKTRILTKEFLEKVNSTLDKQ
ncbi:MAG: radical SAM protein [Nanoarchaeota archaeon]|nr:radical SAM protein [Nanoarchaeota archaeon]